MKKSLWILIMIMALFACFSVTAFAAGSGVSVLVTAENGEKVAITPTNNIFYLPSAVDITKVIFSAETDISYQMGGASGTLKAGEALDLTAGKTQDARGAD